VATYGRIPVAVTLDLANGFADGHGHDVLRSIEGAFGSVLDDVLVGDRTANAFAGSLGDDRIVGRGGADTAIFRDVRGPIRVDLGSGVAVGAGSDVLAGMERVWGTSAADVIMGDDRSNRLVGFDANDEISGRGGNDTLVGGRGADTLDGGDGVDTCSSGVVTLACEA
jgi:Ca2+-binding RTX toxin-like protein